MKIHKYLVLLCSLTACATTCSEIQLIGNGTVGRLVPNQGSEVRFNYLRLDVAAKNDNITFNVIRNDAVICIINLVEEEDGTSFILDDLNHFSGRKRSSKKLNFRLKRPMTYLEVSYGNSHASLSLYNENRKKRVIAPIPGAKSGNFTLDVSSTSSRLLLMSHCQEDRGINVATYEFKSALQDLVGTLQLHWESLSETKKELERSKNSHAEVLKELHKSLEEHAEFQEKLAQAQEELAQVHAESQGKLNETEQELGQAQEELTQAESKSTILMATAIALGILLGILTAALAFVWCFPRWIMPRSATPDTPEMNTMDI